MNLSLLTLNVHSWLEDEPLIKLKQLATYIANCSLDVIALQEINQSITASIVQPSTYFHKTSSQHPIKEDNFAYLLVKELANLGLNYHWSWAYNHIGYDRFEEGVALLSKTPLSPQTLILSENFDPSNYRTRVALVADSTYQHIPLTLVSGHYSWWETVNTGFALEWRTLEAYLQTKKHPLILMGDFNNPAHVLNEGYQLVTNSPLGLQDSFLVAQKTIGEFTVEKEIDGWQANNEHLRIDFIFASKEIDVTSYQIIFDGKKTPVISDHYGIHSQISFIKF